MTTLAPVKKNFGDEQTSMRFITLFGVPYEDGNFKTTPIADISIWNNNPRFNVRSNNPAEDNLLSKFNKPLSKFPTQFALSPPVMNMILTDLVKLAQKKLVISRKVVSNRGYREGKSKANGDKMEVIGAIAYGINDDGHIYMDFKPWNRPVMPFLFKSNFFHEIKEIGSLDASDKKGAELYQSFLMTEHWATMTIEILNRCYFHNYVNASSYKPKFGAGTEATPLPGAQQVSPVVTGELPNPNTLSTGVEKEITPQVESTTEDW